jgi:hypothetical protein
MIDMALSMDGREIVRSGHPAVRSAAEVVLGRWLTDTDPAKVRAAHRARLLMAATDASAR